MLYSIYDVKSESFNKLLEARTDDEACRIFLTIIQNSSNQDLIGLYPQDFSIYRIGDFDISSGILSQDSQPYQLMTGLEAIQILKGNTETSSGCSCSDNQGNLHLVSMNGKTEEV